MMKRSAIGRECGPLGAGALLATWALLCAPLPSGAAEAPPPTPPSAAEARLFGSGSGRFAIIARPGRKGARLYEMSELAWREWSEPLGLPPRLPTPITVRLVPEELWNLGPGSSSVVSQPGGVVTIWIRDSDDSGQGLALERRWLRALAEGALRRKAFLMGVDPALARAPRWLAEAAAEAALVAGQASLLDAWQAAARGAPGRVALRDVLMWDAASTGADASSEEPRARAAYGVWLWLRRESGRSEAWDRFVRALVGGESPGAALAREFPRTTPRPTEAREWELAWDVALAALARAPTTPVMEPAESRRFLETLARIVVFDDQTGAERVLPATGEWATRLEAWPGAERTLRSELLLAEYARVHPFYRNAAGSLGRAWTALAQGRREDWLRASGEWEQDFADGLNLEAASARLLDAAEAAGGGVSGAR